MTTLDDRERHARRILGYGRERAALLLAVARREHRWPHVGWAFVESELVRLADGPWPYQPVPQRKPEWEAGPSERLPKALSVLSAITDLGRSPRRHVAREQREPDGKDGRREEKYCPRCGEIRPPFKTFCDRCAEIRRRETDRDSKRRKRRGRLSAKSRISDVQ